MALPAEPFDQIVRDDPTTQLAILDTLFEPCPSLHAQRAILFSRDSTHSTHVPKTYDNLIGNVETFLLDLLQKHSAPQPEADGPQTPLLDAILSAHPRLGSPRTPTSSNKSAPALSKHSASEQARLTDPTTSGPTAEELSSSNAAYEAAFPGLRYVVFVNGRDRQSILKDMQWRIERGDAHKEREDAIGAMMNIAKDRVKKMRLSS